MLWRTTYYDELKYYIDKLNLVVFLVADVSDEFRNYHFREDYFPSEFEYYSLLFVVTAQKSLFQIGVDIYLTLLFVSY